ncbi:hypothetical protein [Streptomyces hydrogenans]|uniref:hypothetical protein n=1 Tax=Streptomyces hydrogenans TaxID=1873719 RepID=UPI003424DFBC
MIRTQNLRALREGAELASALQTDLDAAEKLVDAFESDAASEMALREELVDELEKVGTELVAAEVRVADLELLVELLLDAGQRAVDAAEAPVEVVMKDGRPRTVHRTLAAIPIPPEQRGMMPTPTPDPDPNGWKIWTGPVPPLPVPGTAEAITTLLGRVRRPEAERLAEADRLQALARELEIVRSQRDTAMKDTETAAGAFTAESLAYAFHKAAVAEAATEIAMALSASDTRASVREVSAVLLRHAKTLGIADIDSTETKGAAA